MTAAHPHVGTPDHVGPHAATTAEAGSDHNQPRDRPAPLVVFADVVVPGKALITAGDGTFSGTVIRDRSRRSGYLVEDEWGEVIGRARTFHEGAIRLARHHDRPVARVELDFETTAGTGSRR